MMTEDALCRAVTDYGGAVRLALCRLQNPADAEDVSQDVFFHLLDQPANGWEGERLKKGVLIRHLILPGQIENSLKILDWIGETFRPGEVLVSLMRQYTPMPGLSGDLARKITEEEYQAVLSWMYLNDLQGFVQEAEAAQQAYIPDF